MANKTMTQVQALTIAIAYIQGEEITPENLNEVVEKFSGMIETLEKKRATPSKAQTAKAEETTNILKEIFAVLLNLAKPATISEIQAQSETLAQLTNQRMSAMLKKLVDNGEIIKTIVKRKAYFAIEED